MFGARGLPADIQIMLGLDVMTWTLLNVPVEALASQPNEAHPARIDAIAGPLVPRHAGDLEEVNRRARWHFRRQDQERARRSMATDLALSRRLLVPDVRHAVAVQFRLACQDPQPDDLGSALTGLGFEQVLVLVGEDAQAQTVRRRAVIRSRVEATDEGLTVRVGHQADAVRPQVRHATPRHLRAGLHRLLRSVELPRRLPCVIDLADQEPVTTRFKTR